MKKVFVFTLICLALLLLVPGVVSADQNIEWDSSQASASGTTEVTYGVASMFSLNIPTTIHVSDDYEGIGLVYISDARIPGETFVNVTVSSTNYNDQALPNQPAWRLRLVDDSIEDYVNYHLHKIDNFQYQGDLTHENTEKVAENEVFLSLEAGIRYKATRLVLFIDDSATHHSGTYKDQLAFTATVTDSTGGPYSPPASPDPSTP